MVFVSQDQVIFYILLNKLEALSFTSLLLYNQAVASWIILAASIQTFHVFCFYEAETKFPQNCQIP